MGKTGKDLFSCPLLPGCSREEVIARLERAGGHQRSYRKGEVIFTPHAFERCLGVLLRGTVTVRKGALPMGQLGPGDLFGAAALYHEEEDYVTTLTPRESCTVLLLSQQQLDDLLSAQPQIARSYIAYLSQRIRFLSGKVGELAGSSAQERVIRYLIAHGGEDGVCPDCSWTELAERLNMGRASLYRALDSLTQKGLLRREGNTVILIGKDEEP